MSTDAERAPIPERPAAPPRPPAPPRPSRAPADASGPTGPTGLSGTLPSPSVPAPPASPPRPAVPPRPGVPPRPASPPSTATRTSAAPGGSPAEQADTTGQIDAAGPPAAVGQPDAAGQPRGAERTDGVAETGERSRDSAAGPGRAVARTAGAAGAEAGEEAGGEPDAEPIPEDESSAHMPQPRENTRETETERTGRVPVPAPRDHARSLRPPAPTPSPRPAPPTGAPLTSHAEPPRPPAPPATGVPAAPSADPAPSTGPFRAVPPAPTVPPPPAGAPDAARETHWPGRHTPLTARTLVAAVCLVLGVGLLGGAGAGMLLSGDTEQRPTLAQGFDGARAAWHEIPVNELFPRTLKGKGAGPGGADRRWTRVAVAPDSTCTGAFDPLLAKALAPVGCARLVRATYTDETTSRVTTVGLTFTKSGPAAMRDLRERFAAQNLTERTDLMPRPYPARGTVAADFGDAQRATWSLHVLQDVPVVVWSVSGFADGRVVTDPQPAGVATRKGETSAAAQGGLGHDAQGIADRVEQRLRKATLHRDRTKDESR